MRNWVIGSAVAACAFALIVGCEPTDEAAGRRVPSLGADAWNGSEWLSAKDAPVAGGVIRKGVRVADGTSWFLRVAANEKPVRRATWMTTGLGVYDLYVNGRRIGHDFLKPGFTDVRKTRRSFTYDVTEAMRLDAGEANLFAAEVSAGWWRDKIVTPNSSTNGFFGRKSAFRGVLQVEYEDGTTSRFGTNRREWRAGVCGPVTHAAIFDGETYDARLKPAYMTPAAFGEPEPNEEFKGEILPSEGGEVTLREDLAMKPVKAYVWRGIEGATDKAFGKVCINRSFEPDEEMTIGAGDTLVVDFGQNAAAVPAFEFSADEGTVLTALPAEMLNDEMGLKSRGNDGPEGSVYRVNLREGHKTGRRVVYTFAQNDGFVRYWPRFTFFGYRYVSVTATAPVRIRSILSVPVTSIRKDMEIGSIETGDAALNRFIRNVYWGQLSNYLSVPTDCPQRNERLGWTADTQVFCEAGSFNANTLRFFHKWMRDLRDSQDELGGFPGVAPWAQYGGEKMRIGWADAGVIVPYRIWTQFGDERIVRENWEAMEKFMARVNETQYRTELLKGQCGMYQYADWLSFEKYESAGGAGKPQNLAFEIGPDGKRKGPKKEAVVYWDFLGGCYWAIDSEMMARMARAIGRDARTYVQMNEAALAYLKGRFLDPADGMLLPIFRDMQTPALFALKLGLVTGEAKARTIAALKKNIADNGNCLQTGFLGTSILMDTLSENGLTDVAYSLLLNHNFPSWLYSVDQGATTVWERWNSYTKKDGFGPVGMNSFNHYAYGSVLAWLYKTAAGIAADPAQPGYRMIVMAPQPDRRLGHVTASYQSAAGLVKSAWRYEGDEWIWEFTVPAGAFARVRLPDESGSRIYPSGTHKIVRRDLR